MPLDEIQNLLHEIYTNEESRNSFFGNRESFLKNNNVICAESRDFFLLLKQNEVEFFAATLYNKRRLAVDHLLPVTKKLLGELHLSFFKAFSQKFTSQGIHKHHEDALAYCNYLLKQQKNACINSAVKFEKEKIKMFLNPKSWHISFFTHNPIALARTDQPGIMTNKLPHNTLTLIIWRNGIVYKTISL